MRKAAKGDKKEKKRALAEIEKLENEMKERHERELEQLKENDDSGEKPLAQPPKQSRAQRRKVYSMQPRPRRFLKNNEFFIGAKIRRGERTRRSRASRRRRGQKDVTTAFGKREIEGVAFKREYDNS